MIDIYLLLYILPAYVANAIPVFISGKLPIDFNYKLNGKPLFGKSKTWIGFLAGIGAGLLTSAIISYFILLPYFPSIEYQLLGGFMLALGTMLGDLIGSFIKRRLGKKEGSPFVLDQFGFIIMALILAYPFTFSDLYSPFNIVFILVLTYIVHILANLLANKIGAKKVPW